MIQDQSSIQESWIYSLRPEGISMNAYSIALKSFKANMKNYIINIFAMIFSIATYYNYVSIAYNPEVLALEGNSVYVAAVSQMTLFVLFFFLGFFVFYSNKYLQKQKMNELGIFAFMGITNRKIGMMLLLETVFMGLFSYALGIIMGTLFGRMFMMGLAKVAILDITVGYYVSFEAIRDTGIVYFMFVLISAGLGYVKVSRSKLIDLFNYSKKENKIPTMNIVRGVLGLIIVLFGYYLVLFSSLSMVIVNGLLAVVIEIAGTIMLYESLITIVLKRLTLNKKIFYNGVNVVSLSNLMYKISENAKSYAVVAILLACAFTSVGTSFSLKYYVDKMYITDSPFTLSYINGDEETDKIFDTRLNELGKSVTLDKTYKFIRDTSENEQIILSRSEFLGLSDDLGNKKINDVKMFPELRGNEVYYVLKSDVLLSFYNQNTVSVFGKELDITRNIQVPVFGSGQPGDYVIVSDALYAELINKGEAEEHIRAVNLSDKDGITDGVIGMFDSMPEDSKLYSVLVADYSRYNLMGAVYFLGSFLGVVFIIATGSIIYFKVTSDAYTEIEKYKTLYKIGMTREQIKESIRRQIRVVFVIPYIIGILHSAVAIYKLSELVKMSLIVPYFTTLLVFTGCYLVFYASALRRYFNLVDPKNVINK